MTTLTHPEKPAILALLSRAQAGDRSAEAELIQRNMGFVVYRAQRVASAYPRHGYSLEDLTQQAVIGMLQAIRTYRVEANVRLSTWAAWKIRYHIQDMLDPRHRIQHGAQRPVFLSLDRAMNSMDGSIQDCTFADHNTPDPTAEIIHRDLMQRLDTLLALLPPNYSTALRMRYGIGCEPCSLREIGAVLGVSRERVRQLCYRGIERIRQRRERT